MIRSRRFVAVVALFLALGTAARLAAEDLDPSRLLDSAQGHLTEKRYGRCLVDLQILVGEVGRLRADELKLLFPTAPEGWTAAEAESSQNGGLLLVGAGSQVKREYTAGGERRATITVTTDAAVLLQGVLMAIQNPAFLGEGKRIVAIKGRKALLDWTKGATFGSLTILLAPAGSMVQIEASGVTDTQVQDLIAGALDLDALEKGIER